jgi:hypothetical protein
MTMIMHNKTSSIGGRHAKSLNKGYRQRELVKITEQNQALLKRLQEKQPNYNTHQWEEDRRVAERRLRNICEYPYQLGITAEGRPRNLSVEMRQTTSAVGPKSLNTSASHQRTSTGKPRRLNPIGKEKAVVFKRGVHIGDSYFIVEMMLAADKLIIFVHEVDQPSSFSLELSMQEAFDIMGGTENYEALAGMLNFENGEIVLNEPQEDSPKGEQRDMFQAPKQPLQLSYDNSDTEALPADALAQEDKTAPHQDTLPQEEAPTHAETAPFPPDKVPPKEPAKAPTPPEEAEKVPTPAEEVIKNPPSEKAPTPPLEKAPTPVKAPTPPPEKAPTPLHEESVRTPIPPAEEDHKAAEKAESPDQEKAEEDLAPVVLEQGEHAGSPPASHDSSAKPEEASSGMKSDSPREQLEESKDHAQPEISHVDEAVKTETDKAAQEPHIQPSEPAKSEPEVSQGEVVSREKEGGELEAGGGEAGEPSE